MKTDKPFQKSFTCAAWMLIVVLLALLSSASAHGQNLIINGSFETPIVTNSLWGWYDIVAGDTALAPWTVALTGVDTVDHSFFAAPVFDGAQCLDLDGFGPGQISQSFATVPGGTYELSFAYANNNNFTVPLSSASAIVRVFDGSGLVLGPITITHSSSASNNLDWQTFSGHFTASNDVTILRFTSLSVSTSSTSGIVLDAVAIIGPQPVEILSQPTSLAVKNGESASFAVEASGWPLFYQWYKNSITLTDFTNATLTIVSTATNDTGTYFVVVSNQFNSVASSNVVLTVFPHLKLPLASPASTIWKYEQSGAEPGMGWKAPGFDDSAWATGRGLFGYETNASYPYPFLTPLTAPGGGGPLTAYFRLPFVWHGAAGCATCTGTAYVDDGAAFYLNGVEIGSRLRLPNGDLTYSVLASNVIEPAIDLLEFSVTNLVVGTNVLAVEVHQTSTNSSDVVFGLGLELEQTLRPPSITNQPQDQVVVGGSNATVSVIAGGTPPLGYQWFHNGTELPGAVNSTFSVGNAAADEAGSYFVVVSNAFGVVTSRVASLKVDLFTISGMVWEDLNGDGEWQRRLVKGENPDVVFVIDVSCSTQDPFMGANVGDVNRDGITNSILDAELFGLVEVNRAMVQQGLGTTARVAIITFGVFATNLDMNPILPAMQFSTFPLADLNTNNFPDIEESLRSITNSCGTSYTEALRSTYATLSTLQTGSTNGNIIFVSDGEPWDTNDLSTYGAEAARLRDLGVNVRAFGAGNGATLDTLRVIDPAARIFTNTEQLVDFFFGSKHGFTYTEPGLPGVTVYLDLNNNGRMDPGEPLTESSLDDPATPNVNETGTYRFTNLVAGNYALRQNPPPGFVATYPTNGDAHLIQLLARAISAGKNFGDASTPAAHGIVSNARANQRPGTTLVDMFYDLGGSGSAYAVSIAVSSDGGATFTLPATHVTGDGVTIPAAPGADKHIVWDAAADFPRQFSTRLQARVMVGSAFALTPIFTVNTRDTALSSLAISGAATVNGGTIAAYQCMAWFSDGSSADVSDSAVWSVVGGNPPAGTFFSLNTLTVGNVDTARTISIRASYTLRNVSGNVTRSSPTLSVTLQPTFHVAFHPEPQSPGTANRTLTFTASPSGHQPPVTYSWDMDNDGQFDDQIGVPATHVFPEFGQFTVRLKAVDGLGRTSVAVGSVSVDRLAPDSPPTLQAATVELGEILDLNGNPFVFDASRTNVGLVIIAHGLCSSARAGWPAEMGRAIEQQLAGSGLPNICLYNWEEAANPVGAVWPGGSECEFPDPRFFENIGRIRPVGLCHGQALADWLKKKVEAGKVRSDRPIHIIGHSAGGFVVGECALTLKRKEAPWVSQVTMLDTPHPVRRHFTEYPNPGKVERYISSLFGRFAPVVDAVGCNEELIVLFARFGLIKLAIGEALSCVIEVDQNSHYHRETIYPLWNVLHYFDHGGAHEWYTGTITNGLEDGYWYSPWRTNAFPAASPGLMPALVSEGLRTAPLPGESVVGFTPFGQVAITNGSYTVTESTDGGIYKTLTVPVGAQELRFRYQFRIAGDGDVLNVFWGTNALLYIGLDNDLSRTGWMEAEVPVSELAGQTNNLVFKLVARGQTNAVLVLDGIELTISQDPDGDGLLTADEEMLGTNPLAYDSDFDGLNDGDEVNVYHTNPLLADTDGDGISDRNEVWAGTDPTRSNSVLKLTSVRLNPDQSISLAWQGATNRFYRVNRSVELGSGNFSTRTNGLPASVPVTTFTEPLGTNAMQFYWIELE